MNVYKKLLIILFILVVVLLIAYMTWLLLGKYSTDASVNETMPDQTSKEKKQIIKNDKVLNEYIEATPFEWEGELKYLVTERTFAPDTEKNLAIYDYETDKKVSEFGEGFGLGSAYVEDGVIYVSATLDWGEQGKSSVYLFRSTDLVNFEKPVLVYRAIETEAIFNSSVTKDGYGKYILAFEIISPGLTPFSISFLESNDLINWRRISHIFGAGRSTAAPLIRWVNGYYYLWYATTGINYLNCDGCQSYQVNVSRSKDLFSWEESEEPVITPDRKDEGVNNSDIDLTDFNGKTYIFYAIGDQATWGGLKVAEYDGTLEQLVSGIAVWNFSEKDTSPAKTVPDS